MKTRSLSKRQLAIILDSIADGVFTIDLEKNVTLFNRAAEQMTGISAGQALGQKCFDVFRCSMCQGQCAMEQTLKTGDPVIDRHGTIINSGGQTVPISVSTAVLQDDRGRTVGGVETFRDESAIEEMRREIENRYSFENIISKNHDIQQMLAVLPDIAQSGSTVLIQGPSGSGKELFARALHNLSPRREGPFVAVNCAALPDTLLESELFGYVRGAFTDARQDRAGRFARARGGTLFLDEIGDISVALQVKLLRVLQEGEYEPLGASAPVQADARIIAATNKDLNVLMAQGRFRDDLYYRLNVIRFAIPPLCRRREDIPLLVNHFVQRFNLKRNRKITGLHTDAMQLLLAYDFPGNIRELEHAIERGFVLCRGSLIKPEHLPPEILSRASAEPAAAPADNALGQAEAQVIRRALARNQGNRSRTARELGMHPTTLWRKMHKLGITDRRS